MIDSIDDDEGIYETVEFENFASLFLHCCIMGDNVTENHFRIAPYVDRKGLRDEPLGRWEPRKTVFEAMPFYIVDYLGKGDLAKIGFSSY